MGTLKAKFQGVHVHVLIYIYFCLAEQSGRCQKMLPTSCMYVIPPPSPPSQALMLGRGACVC